MTSQSDWPELEAEDAQGFRSCFLTTGDGLFPFRISVHFEALRRSITRRVGDLNQYSPAEQKSLKAAAALLAAKVPDDPNVPESEGLTPKELAQLSLTHLLSGTAEITPRAFERFFAGLAQIAIQVASDACVKKALNNFAERFKVPLVTTEESVDILLADLNRLVRMFLNQTGRPLETPEFLQDVHEAVQRLKRESPKAQPTQEKIAEKLDCTSRTLRKRMATYGIKEWDEVLLACKYWEELNSKVN